MIAKAYIPNIKASQKYNLKVKTKKGCKENYSFYFQNTLLYNI